MRRLLILGAVLAASIGTARAITTEEVRAAAETGIPPLITRTDADRFADCGLPPIVPASSADIMRAEAEAKAAGVNIQIVWIRHNLAGIEKCLAGQSAGGRAQPSPGVPPLDLKSPAALALQNAYLLAQAINEHKAEIGPALKRSMMAMSEADKAKLEDLARTERMSFEALAVMRTVAPFAGVSVTDYEAFRAYMQMSGWSGGK